MSLAFAFFKRFGRSGRARDGVFEMRLATLVERQKQMPTRHRPSPFRFSSRHSI